MTAYPGAANVTRSAGVAALVSVYLLSTLGLVTPAQAATLFDDPMGALKYLSPSSATCTAATSARRAFCLLQSAQGMFQAEFATGEYPQITITTLTPGLSLGGMEYTIAFQVATERLGITDGGRCVPKSLAGNGTVLTVEGAEYRVDCSARVVPMTKTVESRLVITSNVRMDGATVDAAGPALESAVTGDWPGGWKVTALPDGRLYARVAMLNGDDGEYGGFSTFGIICARGGGLKVGFESLDGSSFAEVILDPQNPSAFRLPLVNNEIRGPQAEQFLRDLADIETIVRAKSPAGAIPIAFSAYEGGDYVSNFDLDGIAKVTAALRQRCSP